MMHSMQQMLYSRCITWLRFIVAPFGKRRFTSGLNEGNVLASIDLVVSLSRNYASHTTTRIRVVALPTRNEVNVAMHHRLAGSRAAIDPDVETQHGRICPENKISGFSEQLLAGSHLGRAKVKIVGSMPLRDDEQMPFRYRVLVSHDHGQAILTQDRFVASRAKRASGLHVLIGCSNSLKSVSSRSLFIALQR